MIVGGQLNIPRSEIVECRAFWKVAFFVAAMSIFRIDVFLQFQRPSSGALRGHIARRPLDARFGHTIFADCSGSQQPTTGNARKCFAHATASDGGVVVGLTSQPPPVAESEVPT